MKKLLSLIGAVFLLAGCIPIHAQQTNAPVVVFATQFFTGQALNNGIMVTSLNTPYSTSNNLVAGISAYLMPTNGVAVTNLFPGDYIVVIDGMFKSFVITIPQTTNVVNAAQSLKAGVSGLNVYLWTNTIPFTVVVTQYLTQNFSGTNIIDVAELDHTVIVGTNGSLRQLSLNVNITNAVNHGNAFSSPHSGSAQSEQFGASALAGATQATAVGNQADAVGTASTAIGASSGAGAAQATAVGELSTADGAASIALGFSSTASFNNSIAIGANASTSTGNQVMLGDSSVTQISLAGVVSIIRGTGSPAGAVSAPVGSLYLNSSGGAGTTLWVKESGGSGSTGWVGK